MMSKTLNWKAKFGISDAEWMEWNHNLPPGEDVLLWALAHNKLPEAEYLQWASAQTELPILRSEFFPVAPEFWFEVKDKGPWSANLVPLARWQDLLIAGCVLPPENIPPQTLCVLVPAQVLKTQWDTWQTTPAAPELPDGFLNAKADVDFSALMPTTTTAVAAPPLPATPPAMPMPSTPPPSASPSPSRPSPSEVIVLSAASSSPPPALTPPPPPPPDPDLEEPEVTMTKSVNFSDLGEAPAPTSAPPPTTALSAADRFEKVQSFDSAADLAMLKLEPLFPQRMFLVFQGGSLKPWKWQGTWQPPSDVQTFNVQDRSFFRIVFVSCLPYHGYVTPNPINDQFFAQWNKGQRAKHLTLTPVLVGHEIAGMLLGLTENPPAEFDNLRSLLAQAEDIARGVSMAFERLKKTPSKAA